MSTIGLVALEHEFGSKVILGKVDFQFPVGERIALVGANGAGKTTLLRIITGELTPSAGQVVMAKNVRLGYLPQEPNQNPKTTVLEEAVIGAETLAELKEAMDQAMKAMESNDHEAGTRYAEFEERFRKLGGYQLESDAERILDGLGFREDMVRQSPLELSGGWRMRVELAKILLNQPDVLILDEPTNHLDLPSLAWVENYLKTFEGTLIYVSHDRALLNRLSTVTVELKSGALRSFPGNFDRFLDAREEQLATEMAQKEQLAKKRQQLERFVERFGAKNTKATQAKSKMKMIAKMRSFEDGLAQEEKLGEMAIRLPVPRKSGRIAYEVKGGGIGYSETLASNINLKIERGMRLAVIGANGIGKSTFLKTVSHRIPKLDGEFSEGHQVEIAYFAQEQVDTLDYEKTVLDNVVSAHNDVTSGQARNLLGQFLFRGDDVFKRTSVLSGGEKSRVGLARCLLSQGNFLLLDEPTNHLDMSSVAVLAESLGSYEGTLLFVSHDREFIDSVATHIFVMLPDGRNELFEGQLDDYERLAAVSGFPNILQVQEKTKPARKQKVDTGRAQNRETQKQQRRLKGQVTKLEEQQEKLKVEIEDLLKQMHSSSTDHDLLMQLQGEVDAKRDELEKVETSWLEKSEELESLINASE